jgi:hypothetical protein
LNFDLNILPINWRNGREISNLTGVRSAVPPRKAARGRDNDRLVIYLVPNENAEPDMLERLLNGIEKTYFNTPGTVTTAVRVVMDEVNAALLNYNLKREEKRVMAFLSLVVMRGELLYVAQSGLNHGFLFQTSKFDYLHDPETAGRGLGLGQTVGISFAQKNLENGMLLILTPKIPSGWNEGTLQGAFGQQMRALEKRLLSDAGNDLLALVVGVQAGSGRINLAPSSLQEKKEAVEPSTEAASQSEPAPPLPQPAVEEEPASVEPPEPVEGTKPAPRRARRRQKKHFQLQTLIRLPRKPAPEQTKEESQKTQPKERKLPSFNIPPGLSARIMGIGRTIGVVAKHILNDLRSFFLRSLPMEGELDLPTSTMASIAIAVPLVVVTISILFYLQVGLPKQQKAFFERAQFYATEAQELTDAKERYASWSEALKYINLAEQYKKNDETKALRAQIEGKLDVFDRVTRLNFQQATTTDLAPNTEIVQMVATARELFMLDKKSGSVLHARLIDKGYDLDNTFRCGPGEYGSVIMGPITDIAALPRTTQESTTLLAMDTNGTLLYCEPGSSPTAGALIPPENNWGSPSIIAVDEQVLYVLDKLTNAIWIYNRQNGEYGKAPTFFFSKEIPSIEDVVDFTVGQGQTYLLHDDGHVTICTYSGLKESPTTCTDPATLQDDRPGHESGPTIGDARFYQVVSTQPPEPSIYFLDPISRSLYQFSIKLNIVQEFKSAEELPAGLATAFTVNPTRSVFVAIGNQVFTAVLP